MQITKPNIERATPRTLDEAYGFRPQIHAQDDYPHLAYDLSLIVIGVAAIAFAVTWVLLGN